jgi:UDP-N-acetylglucosamine 2-epimerase (non-hydrolysing)
VEAGLRSRDMAMPEEINRLCTDVLCDYLFTTDVLADRNLIQEGVAEEKIHFVGNVMIDTLLKHSERASKLPFPDGLNVTPGEYAVLTLHRPSNVDDRATLEGVLKALAQVSGQLPIVFPIHPRTDKMVRQFDLGHYLENSTADRGFRLIEPIGYLDFLHLNMNARMILTDSGGIQEEATVLGVPCITLRFNTERPITCEMGTNVLVGNREEDILAAAEQVLADPDRDHKVPDRWDGKAADRIVQVLMDDDER